MEYFIAYASGYLIAFAWTIKKMWNHKDIQGPKPLKLLFSAIMGVMSWMLVLIYILMWIYENDKPNDNGNITAY